MLPVLLAGVIGAAIGALRRPHGSHLRMPTLVFPAIVAVGAVLHLTLGMFDPDAQGPLLGVSLAMLTGFTAVNRHIPGMGVLTIGLALNMGAVLVNGAMPVRPSALVDAGAVTAEQLADTDPGAGRRFEENGDAVGFLGDIIPVEPFEAAMSFGDLIALMGIGAVSGELARHARRGSRSVGRNRRLDPEIGGELRVDLESIGIPQRRGDVEELTTLIDLVDAENRVGDEADSESDSSERPRVPLTR